MSSCARCHRNLSAEKPVRLPDALEYCAACCDSMATDSFEMETGEPFVKWIEKHPKLTMRYQPMELSVRRLSFVFPLCVAIGGVGVALFGCVLYFRAALPMEYLAAYMLAVCILVGAVFYVLKKDEGKGTGVAKILASILAFLLPAAAVAGIWKFGNPAATIATGLFSAALFGALSSRGLQAYLRAKDFELELENGLFRLVHGKHIATFNARDVTRACVVRPGTVGALEGALGFKDGSMLTLDSCLSDLHALGVVMDLRFRDDFPPSPDDLAKVRRDKLRKIRGLAD